MNIDKTIIATLLILCFVITIPATLYFRKIPPAELLPPEKELIGFSSTPVAMSEPKPPPVFSGLDCPVKPVTVQVVTPQTMPITKNLPPKSPDSSQADADPKKLQSGSLNSLPTVSMIYYECGKAKVIIGGQILHVGATFGNNNEVLKIEKTRVQIRRSGKDIWLNMY